MEFAPPKSNLMYVPTGCDGPHLAVMTGPEEWTGLPKGARFLIVPDPKRADRIIPAFLADVRRDALVFRCNCGHPKCTRVLSYKLRVAGHHPTTSQAQV